MCHMIDSPWAIRCAFPSATGQMPNPTSSHLWVALLKLFSGTDSIAGQDLVRGLTLRLMVLFAANTGP